MKCYVSALAALAVALPALAIGQTAQADVLTRNKPQGAPIAASKVPPALARRDAQVTPASRSYGDGFPGPGPGGDSCCEQGPCDGGCYCPDQCCDCDPGYGCNSCGPCGGSCGWGNWCNLFYGPGGQRPWFFTADYLYVRANVSDAPAYVFHDTTNFVDTFHELDFQYQSSYRFGAGYQLPCCGEQIRFLFTRLTSSADTNLTNTDDNTIQGPFETSPGPGGTFSAHGQIDVKSYDVEFAKTIPLGGCSTGCGDCCRPSCPAWDITWEGGFRFADVNWDRIYSDTNPDAETSRTAISKMAFQGGGPRFGVEGRRYFGQRQWLSAYLKGDISLLLGNVRVTDRRTTVETGNPPGTTEMQSADFRNIIPVTEIETGLTGQLTRSVTLSAGYLFSAYHDLGFRDEFNFATETSFLNTNYDDANILGFDGFFARLEVDF